MPNPFTCVRLFADETGESHFEDIEFKLTSILCAPPALSPDLSDPIDSGQSLWMRFPEGWHAAAHPSPRRQVFVLLEGEIECWTSDGDMRILNPGNRLLMEDTTGKGHGARTINGEAFGVMIALN